MKKFTLGICAFVLSLSLVWSPRVRADAVTDWNAHAAITMCGLTPPHESRLYAMMHLAIHDALNTINRRFHPYVLDMQGPSGASAEAAVATAAHDVLVPALKQLVPVFYQIPAIQDCIAGKDGVIASVEADYAAALDGIPEGAPKTQGIAIGHAAAAVILALRVVDGSDTLLLDFDYPQGTHPGEYRFTPEAPFAVVPGWGDVTPFVLHDSAQFRPGPPYAVTSPKYTADFNEVKSLGARVGSTRTAEQTQIALFWLESPPSQWNRIARTISEAAGLDMWENARLFALLNMALADGNIGTAETKYHYNYWRPQTAIQTAETDGNPDTIADLTWVPLGPEPPIPEYDSAHSVVGGAAAQVLLRFFEANEVSFSACSLTLPLPEEQCGGSSEVRRVFSSFTAAADENGVSRIYVGYHFRKAVEEGIAHGRKIGNRAVNLFLRPVH
jgi:PAP2 superfamily